MPTLYLVKNTPIHHAPKMHKIAVICLENADKWAIALEQTFYIHSNNYSTKKDGTIP